MSRLLASFAIGRAPLNEVAVITPDTLTSSNSVCPSTSKSPFASIAPVNVDTPETLKLVVSNCPNTVAPIPDVEKRFVSS